MYSNTPTYEDQELTIPMRPRKRDFLEFSKVQIEVLKIHGVVINNQAIVELENNIATMALFDAINANSRIANMESEFLNRGFSNIKFISRPYSLDIEVTYLNGEKKTATIPVE